MAAYRLVYDSRHLQADCQEPGSAPEPYARRWSMGYLYFLVVDTLPHPALSQQDPNADNSRVAVSKGKRKGKRSIAINN